MLRVCIACCGDLRLGVRLGSVEVSHGYCRHGVNVSWEEMRGESGRDGRRICECGVRDNGQQKKELLRVCFACCGDLRLGVRLSSVEVSHGYCRHGGEVSWKEM